MYKFLIPPPGLRILFISLLFLFYYCGENKKSKNDITDISTFDKSKLAAEIIDSKLGIKFNPPLNWSLKPAELSKKNESKSRMISSDEINFVYHPIYLFFNDSTMSLMSVGYVDCIDTSMNPSEKFNYYKNVISNKWQSNNIEIGSLSHSKINFSKFKYEIGDFVNYKIVFMNLKNTIIVFDCTIRKNKIDNELEALKSAIGSIELIR